MEMHAHAPLEPSGLQQGLLESRDRFLGYVRKRVDDPELAEDILQDSFLRAIQAAPSLRQKDRLVPWFYSVLHNAIIDAYRRRGGENRRVTALDGVDVAEEVEDEAALCACFEPIFATLKPEYAELIRAVDLGGETPEAAAERLGITPVNLRVRRYRARQALRQRLEQTCRTCADHGCLDCTCRPDPDLREV
jgi:RNA polymerase sigma-70 factor, ECF subfamily